MTYPRIRRVTSRLEDVVCEAGLGAVIHNPAGVAKVCQALVGHEAIEVFGVLLLNTRREVTGYAEISRGTLNASLVHPREVFGPAIRLGAAAIVVFHNHPSGDPSPSREDQQVTTRLHKAGKLLGIPLLDHIIVGGDTGAFTSLREDGHCE